VKRAYKILKAGGPSIFGQDTWSQINFSLTGKSKKGGAPTSNIAIREIAKRKVPMRSGPSDHERSWVVDRRKEDIDDHDLECRNTSSQECRNAEMRNENAERRNAEIRNAEMLKCEMHFWHRQWLPPMVM
jgi:hypothetical protein